MQRYYDIISGKRNDAAAMFYRLGLGAISVPYGLAVRVRNYLYDKQIRTVHQFFLPVISVGNLTLGGTGKTPVVAYLVKHFLSLNLRAGIVSRGYRKNADGTNDEYRELAFRFPNTPHIQNPDRVAGAKELLNQAPTDVLILDDAFQHRRIARTLDIVLLDATQPFGFGHLFPRGTLREPLTGLRRADIVLLSRADMIAPHERKKIRDNVLRIAPDIVWGEIAHYPENTIAVDQKTYPLDSLRGKTALAFCGIGNPAAFRRTLEICGVRVAELLEFPDHYLYAARGLNHIEQMAENLIPDVILCTMKDIVKIDCPTIANIPVQAVSVGIRFFDGEAAVLQRIEQSLGNF
ncbi:tetraacyldisaccharide 4'-kinase [Planctomycetales bacterium]|nr:tetraacyldisaccharide 4'-kinase [Planctomycetales bacterium]